MNNFIDYYKNLCNEYIIDNKTKFSSFYLHKWYTSIGEPELNIISVLVYQVPLNNDVESFVRSCKKTINKALKQKNDTFLLENLFSVPGRLRKFLSKNGTSSDII